MTKIHAYLRVSSDKQDTENQKLGLLEYANEKGLSPVQIYEETSSRSVNWKKRKIAQIIDLSNPGDILLTPEFSRIAGSTLQVLEILQAANEKGMIIHITKQRLIMDQSLQSEILAVVLGLAAQIERHFIQTRTREALKAAKERGVNLGRPKGSSNKKLKLDTEIDQVQLFVNLGLSKIKAAKILNVTPKTYAKFIKERGIKPQQV